MFPYGFYFDSTYIYVLIGMGLVMLAQYLVKSTFSKYNQYATQKNISGQQAADHILRANNIHGVRIERVRGALTDHYDPQNKVLRLSDATYDQTSIAAVAVAAHECGHAVQDAVGYPLLRWRAALVPVTQFGSSIGMPLIIIGFLFQLTGLIWVGIIALSAALLFQLVTLPVELDASRRALKSLEAENVFRSEELPAARKVLRAAAFTYLAATISTALQIFRLILLSNRSRRD